jgi:hypothetical protein
MAKFLEGQIPVLTKSVAREEIPARERRTNGGGRRRTNGAARRRARTRSTTRTRSTSRSRSS